MNNNDKCHPATCPAIGTGKGCADFCPDGACTHPDLEAQKIQVSIRLPERVVFELDWHRWHNPGAYRSRAQIIEIAVLEWLKEKTGARQ